MNVIITGVAGMIGSNFCHYLLENKNILGISKIYGIDDLSGGYTDNILTNDVDFVFTKADLTNDFTIIENIFLTNNISYIFHFAAYAPEGLSPFIRKYNYISNIIPTAFLINMAIKYKIKRFVFTSSMATYGDNITPFTEDMLPNPVDPYGIAKYACEMDLKVAFEQHDLEYCIILPHNVYGKYQNIWDPYRNVLGIWMYQSLHNLPITIYGDGEQTRSFSYIDDMLPCLWKSAISSEAKNQRINLGSKNHISLKDVSKIVMKITGHDKYVHLEGRREVKHAWSSYEKSEKILGFVENVSLEEGLKRMWEWVKSCPDREVKYWKEYELDSKIYSFWK